MYFLLLEKLIVLYGFFVAVYHSFITTWKTLFCISCRVSSSNELNSFSFCFLTFSLFFKAWFSQIQCSFLKISFCLSVFWSYYLTNFWISKFLLKNPLITWWNIPCIWQITSYFAFRIHSLSLTLDSLSITCLSMTLGFLSWRFFSFLYLCYFLRFGIFFFFNCYFFKVLFHFLSFSSLEILIMCVFIPVISFCKVLSHSVLSFILFCFHSSHSMISNALPSSLLILSSTYSFFLLLSVLVLNTYN